MLNSILASKLFRAGLVVLAIGYLPLLLIILAAKLGLSKDPNPNPVGPGLLAMLATWPAAGLLVAGVIRGVLSGRSRGSAPPA